MDLPIKFPSDTEVILEEVGRFRTLPPEKRIEALRGLVAFGARLQGMSPKAAWMKEYAEEQERLAQRRVREFLARHGH